MAAITSSAIKLVREGVISGAGRFKIYRITKNGTGDSASITPGLGFKYVLGASGETSAVTLSSGVFSCGFHANTSGNTLDLMFLSF